jgi:hypothetical protein
MNTQLSNWLQVLKSLARYPRTGIAALKTLPCLLEGLTFARSYQKQADATASLPQDAPAANSLYNYFRGHNTGLGIWKWEHYFEIYERHLARFVGKPLKMVEIGVYSGGSLEMWINYFGPQCMLYGVDIEEACRVYASENTSIFIGDQGDKNFWRSFTEQVPHVDVVIDDGGHEPGQQIATLQALLPVLNGGGVYICEDIHERHNGFAVYASALVDELNAVEQQESERQSSAFQSLFSLHFYPYLLVIEKRPRPLKRLCAPKQGTQWEPFFEPMRQRSHKQRISI